MDWNENLPDVSKWQPNFRKQDTLANALMITCQVAQRRIQAVAKAEIGFNINNFDSGAGVEDIVREELSNLLPNRYSVEAGVVNDHNGKTAGDCDLLVRDSIWSPAVKLPAAKQSRRSHYPIEGVYAVAEIKQTLGFKELDDAMEKLVAVAKLQRADNPYGHITENQHLQWLDKAGYILNPLHKAVIATRLPDGVRFGEIVQRFGAINELLDRTSMVNMLCVLGEGAAWYSVESGNPYNATFMWDRDEPLILQINYQEPGKEFYRFYVDLLGHLTRSVLNIINIDQLYGQPPPNRRVLQYPKAKFNAPT